MMRSYRRRASFWTLSQGHQDSRLASLGLDLGLGLGLEAFADLGDACLSY